MKLVITDGYCENPGDLSWEPLKQFGELVIYDRTEDDEDKIIDRIGDADIAIINKVPITERIMDACPNLKAIAILATGYNVVDIDAAKKRGIPVCNVPAYGTDAVAEFAMSLLLELCHHVGHHADAVKEGRWESCPDFCFWDIR